MDSILGLQQQELADWLKAKEQPGYRTNQILQWIYNQAVESFPDMANLPGELRKILAEKFILRQAKVVRVQDCPDGAVKLLLQWPDEALTETVLIPQSKGYTICVSSQVGCAVKCVFCASGLTGLERSLQAEEIVEQVMQGQKILAGKGRISNVVIMGMGEPFANYDQCIKAVGIINAAWGLNIGARHITISTIGIPDKIRKLAHEPLQVTLAVSLHAGDDDLRGRLIPLAKEFKLVQLFDAIDYYYQQTHREVTLEYIMLHGVNCSADDAVKLTRWCQRSRCNVNLINYNVVADTGYRPARAEEVQSFMNRLRQNSVNVHLRKSYGSEIDAACGQLRNRKIKKTQE